MKFNKTETKVMEKVSKYGHFSYDTGVTKGRTFGRRFSNACASLRKKGLLKLHSTNPWRERNASGTSVCWVEAVNTSKTEHAKWNKFYNEWRENV